MDIAKVRASRRRVPRLSELERRSSASAWSGAGDLLGVVGGGRPAISLTDPPSNRGVITESQYQPWGYALLGSQWREVSLCGTLAMVERFPFNRVAAQPGDAAGPATPVVNAGLLGSSQFNVGGFSRIGMQWRRASLGGSIRVDDYDESYGQDAAGGAPIVPNGGGARPEPSPVPSPSPVTYDVPASAGTILQSQFSDGGFGDIGLQWRDVTVGGDVLAVHNSLSVQPEDKNQGMIRLAGIRFPSLPWDPSGFASGDPSRTLPADPDPISGQGGTPGPLPPPTGYRDRAFPINAATNSGPITDSQFSDGGFGDIGLQWSDVNVGGPVRLVHNSLSIKPQGMNLAGVVVSDVHFGASPGPITAVADTQAAEARAARFPGSRISRPIHRTIRPPRAGSPYRAKQVKENQENPPAQASEASKTRSLQGRQTADSLTANVTLQWLNSYRTPDNLVIVHNVLAIHAWGRDTARISLKDVQFAANTPRVNALALASTRYLTQARPGPSGSAVSAVVARPDGRGRALLTVQADEMPPRDQATNSGQLADAQFSDGGFGDVGLQWRDVSVGGGVDVIHNSLSINVTGHDTGPIRVANVSFASGALDDLPAGAGTRRIVPPPRVITRSWAPPLGTVGALPISRQGTNLATNNGIITGGQFSDGGFGDVAMQASGVSIPGRVTIVHNVLEIQTAGNRTGPISLSEIQFE